MLSSNCIMETVRTESIIYFQIFTQNSNLKSRGQNPLSPEIILFLCIEGATILIGLISKTKDLKEPGNHISTQYKRISIRLVRKRGFSFLHAACCSVWIPVLPHGLINLRFLILRQQTSHGKQCNFSLFSCFLSQFCKNN